MVRQKIGPQMGRRRLKRDQKIRRRRQTLRRQQSPGLPGQQAVQGTGGGYQHRPSLRGLPKAGSSVQQRRQLHHPARRRDPDGNQLSPDTVSRRRPENHRQHQIGRPGGEYQNPAVDVRIKHASHRRDLASGQQPQRQYAPRHGAGDRQQQQRQPEKPLLATKGDDRQQHSRRRLYRACGEKAHSRQKRRCGVGPAGQGRQQIPPSPEGDTRQPSGGEQQQVIHQGVEDKHAVDVNHRHGAPPLLCPMAIL